jgi:hypothetical protein
MLKFMRHWLIATAGVISWVPLAFRLSPTLGIFILGLSALFNSLAAGWLGAVLGWDEFPLGIFLFLWLFEASAIGFVLARTMDFPETVEKEETA